MNIKIRINQLDFPKVEMFLFSLTYPNHCFIEIAFNDSDEIYKYKTVELCGKLVLITQ